MKEKMDEIEEKVDEMEEKMAKIEKSSQARSDRKIARRRAQCDFE